MDELERGEYCLNLVNSILDKFEEQGVSNNIAGIVGMMILVKKAHEDKLDLEFIKEYLDHLWMIMDKSYKKEKK